MSNFIIGTSGHIDHGKTSLIKALTGINTDRLKEEQEKGISIDIGFSYLKIGDNNVGIIDIPGHEKFIKNMLAGASGIDICLLIIACDDGIMPQTREHFDIINLLGIKHGIVVLNKIDRVEEDLIQKRINEINEFTKSSFLENAPIIKTSIYNEDTINDLKIAITTLINSISQNQVISNVFRMPIDRFFKLKGIGSVITGTTIGSFVKVGDKLEILPQKSLVTVKSIQNHNVSVEKLGPNNRCALNINIHDKIEIVRGNVIATPNLLSTSTIIDVKINCLKTSSIPIKNGQKVKVYHLANEVMARIKLLCVDEIIPGDLHYGQLILDKPIIALNDDMCIIRNTSPLITIGGAKIINVVGKKVKRNNNEYLEMLKNSNDSITQIENILSVKNDFINQNELQQLLAGYENYEQVLQVNLKDRVLQINNYYCHINYFNELKNQIITYLNEFHEENSMIQGASISIIKDMFFPNKKNQFIKEFLEVINVSTKDTFVYINNFIPKLNPIEAQMKQFIIDKYKQNGYNLAKVDDIKNMANDKKLFDQVFKTIVNDKGLIFLEDNYFILQSCIANIMEFISNLETITLKDIKDYTNASRKNVVMILEYLDRKQITKRIDDYRVLIKRGVK